MDKAKQLVDEGNKHRVVVLNEEGKTVFDIPLTVAVVGGIIVFPATAVGVIAALATRHSIVVESVATEAANGGSTTDGSTTATTRGRNDDRRGAIRRPDRECAAAPTPHSGAGRRRARLERLNLGQRFIRRLPPSGARRRLELRRVAIRTEKPPRARPTGRAHAAEYERRERRRAGRSADFE